MQDCASRAPKGSWKHAAGGLNEDWRGRPDTVCERLVAARSGRAAQPAPARPTASRELNYDVQEERNAELLRVSAAQAAACMREGSVAQLRQGIRDREAIQAWTAAVCGGPLFSFMTKQLGRPAAEVNAYVNALAGQALNAALRGPDAIIVR